MMPRPGQFISKAQAHGTRKQQWACVGCNFTTHTKPGRKHCDCGHPLHYFPSRAEMNRFHSLRLEQRCKLISGLELQPKFIFVANGKQFATYKADFKYTRDGETIHEDVKGTTDRRYLEKDFLLKKEMVDAFFGIEIHIVKG